MHVRTNLRWVMICYALFVGGVDMIEGARTADLLHVKPDLLHVKPADVTTSDRLQRNG